jgi:DNA-binding transcriptional MocR family regulator
MQPTKRQGEYLDFIRAFTDRWGTPPSFEEIGRHFGTTAPSVNNMIKMLESRGFLTRVPGAPRTLRVLLPKDAAPTPTAPSPTAPSSTTGAVHLGALVLERLLPALKGADEQHIRNALDAVAAAVDVACVEAGADEKQRDEARDALRRVVLTARGIPTEQGPRRRSIWTRR